MTGRDFVKALTNAKTDVLHILLDILRDLATPYCVIDDMAVNAYVEPVVSLDLDIVAGADDVAQAAETAVSHSMKRENFEHSVNLSSSECDLRIQLQRDPRYQPFVARAVERDVLGYRMRVAALEDVLQGKAWAYLDEQRRKSKRQKDLADILRLVEAYPELAETLPDDIRQLAE